MADEHWLESGISAALLGEFTKDQRSFFALFARFIESTLPNEAVVKYQGFFGKREPESLEITLGSFRYSMVRAKRGSLVCIRSQIVRGISIKNEDLSVEAWLSEFETSISSEAAKSNAAQRALAELLGL